MRFGDPSSYCLSSLLAQLEAHRLFGLLLGDARSGKQVAAVSDVEHSELHEIAGSELAIDGQVEKCELAGLACHL